MKPIYIALPIFVIAGILNASAAGLTQVTWQGSTSNFDLGSNWAGSSVPNSADAANFNGTGGYTTTLSVTSSTTVGGLTFNSSPAYTIGTVSSATLTLDSASSTNLTTLSNNTSNTITFSSGSVVIQNSVGTGATVNIGTGAMVFNGSSTLTLATNIGSTSNSGGSWAIDGTLNFGVSSAGNVTLNFNHMGPSAAATSILYYAPTTTIYTGTTALTDSAAYTKIDIQTSIGSGLSSLNVGNGGTTTGAIYINSNGVSVATPLYMGASSISMVAGTTYTFGMDSTSTAAGTLTGSVTLYNAKATSTGTYNFDVAANNALTISGAIADSSSSISTANFAVTKTSTGTLVLSSSTGNSFTNAIAINAGTLEAAGSGNATAGSGSLNNTSSVTVNGGGTLLFGATDAINHSASLTTFGTAGGGNATISLQGITNGATEVMGALTLNSGTTIIDFGSGSTKNTLEFSSLTINAGAVIDVYDWNGPDYNIGGTDTGTLTSNDTQDRLLFASLAGVTQSELSQISFYSGNGTGFIGTGAEIAFPNGGSYQNEVAVPEPSTVFAGVCLLGLVGWRSRRRLQELVGGSIPRAQTLSGHAMAEATPSPTPFPERRRRATKSRRQARSETESRNEGDGHPPVTREPLSRGPIRFLFPAVS